MTRDNDKNGNGTVRLSLRDVVMVISLFLLLGGACWTFSVAITSEQAALRAEVQALNVTVDKLAGRVEEIDRRVWGGAAGR